MPRQFKTILDLESWYSDRSVINCSVRWPNPEIDTVQRIRPANLDILFSVRAIDLNLTEVIESTLYDRIIYNATSWLGLWSLDATLSTIITMSPKLCIVLTCPYASSSHAFSWLNPSTALPRNVTTWQLESLSFGQASIPISSIWERSREFASGNISLHNGSGWFNI